MTSPGFILGALALLAVPGPTNALLLVAGTQGGVGRALTAACAAMLGYLLAVILLGGAIGPLLLGYPVLVSAIRLGAAGYLLLAALKLWRTDIPSIGASRIIVSPGAVFLTTLLNPKALILAFALMPEGWTARMDEAILHLGVLCGLVFGISTLWSCLGRLLRSSLERNGAGQMTSRLSAIVLGLFGVALAIASFSR
jgi:threonine/homoserine/homoserine lactone efflux protein